jgi:hypothetical protein
LGFPAPEEKSFTRFARVNFAKAVWLAARQKISAFLTLQEYLRFLRDLL